MSANRAADLPRQTSSGSVGGSRPRERDGEKGSRFVLSPCDDAVIRSGAEARACEQRAERAVLIAAIIGSSMTFIDGTVVNVALPVLREALGASLAQAQWVVESYMLFLSSLMLVGGALGDRWGRRLVFVWGVVLFAAASSACALAGNITQLILARGAQGIGAALLVPGSLSLISATFSQPKWGAAMGTWPAVTSIAGGIGP